MKKVAWMKKSTTIPKRPKVQKVLAMPRGAWVAEAKAAALVRLVTVIVRPAFWRPFGMRSVNGPCTRSVWRTMMMMSSTPMPRSTNAINTMVALYLTPKNPIMPKAHSSDSSTENTLVQATRIRERTHGRPLRRAATSATTVPVARAIRGVVSVVSLAVSSVLSCVFMVAATMRSERCACTSSFTAPSHSTLHSAYSSPDPA
mmetsp:Transcript_81372/g.230594  ORF Transcript_81372/g.230594 Transcript_81372/m.230594 type:complete len:202 (+) Transcript_81372:1515-2120(+)